MPPRQRRHKNTDNSDSASKDNTEDEDLSNVDVTTNPVGQPPGSKGDNQGQSTGSIWTSVVKRAKAKFTRGLDLFEVVVIINIGITILLVGDVVIRRIDVSTNTPDERIVNLESRFSKVDSKIIEFQSDFIDIKQRLISVESDVTDIKSRLDTLESNGKYKQIERKIETEIKYLDTKYQNDIENLNQKIPSEEKIDKALSVTEDFKQLKQKVDTIGQELEGAKVSLGETQNSISTFKKDLKNVADKQEEWLINHDTKPKQPVENTTQLKLEIDELRQNFKQTQGRLKAEAVEYYTNNIKETHVTIETLKTNIGKVKAELKTEIGERKQNVKEIDGNMADMKGKISKIEVELKTEIGERQQNVKEINGNMADMKGRINKVEVELKTEIGERQQNVNEINRNMADMKGRIKKVEVELKTEIGERKQSITILDEKIIDRTTNFENKLQNHIQDSSEKISALENGYIKINDLNNNLKEVNIVVMDHDEKLSEVYRLQNYQGKIHDESKKDNDRNFLRYDHAILFFIVIIILIIILILIQYKKPATGLDQKHTESSSGPISKQRFVPSRSVLDQIQHQGILKQEVCVVSFYSETQPLHQRLTKSAVPDGTQIKTIVVENHDKILKLPHSKTFLVFVDFNERNIILENTEREIGDLKLTTVQGALKLGGSVYVIYVRDAGSKSLPDGQLINSKLTSIYNHTVLNTLNKENKVLTTYDELTPYQKVHLNKNLW